MEKHGIENGPSAEIDGTLAGPAARRTDPTLFDVARPVAGALWPVVLFFAAVFTLDPTDLAAYLIALTVLPFLLSLPVAVSYLLVRRRRGEKAFNLLMLAVLSGAVLHADLLAFAHPWQASAFGHIDLTAAHLLGLDAIMLLGVALVSTVLFLNERARRADDHASKGGWMVCAKTRPGMGRSLIMTDMPSSAASTPPGPLPHG